MFASKILMGLNNGMCEISRRRRCTCFDVLLLHRYLMSFAEVQGHRVTIH